MPCGGPGSAQVLLLINLLLSTGQQPATQKKQDPSQGKTVGQGDPKIAGPKYTTASAAWEGSLLNSHGAYSSPALAKGLWGQSRGFHSAAVLGFVKDKHDRPDSGSDVGGIQDGSSDINTGDAEASNQIQTDRADIAMRTRAYHPCLYC